MESQTQLEYAAMDLFLLPFRVSWSGCWARSAALRSTFGLVAEQLGVDPEAAAPAHHRARQCHQSRCRLSLPGASRMD